MSGTVGIGTEGIQKSRRVMKMFTDSDIKIAGDKPSEDVKRDRRKEQESAPLDSESVNRARQAGKKIAERFATEADSADSDDFRDYGLLIQRRLLLSFTATVGIEENIKNDALAGIVQKSFLDELKRTDSELYKTSSDMGAFSFYYLAFRRGTEIDRRIGQTFAMLCSHDGDPIFQELGEALYCWFSSVVKKIIKEQLQ